MVTPSRTTESGHRLYTDEDIARLQQVISLKQLGFGQDAIKSLMESRDYDPAEVLRIQKERLRETIQRQQLLHAHLEELHALVLKRERVSTE
nr:MerR family transcriptional regulator [Cohnella sp. CFH 77786]